MGLVYADARALLEWRKSATGGRAVTFGRLSLYLHRSELRQLATMVDAAAADYLRTAVWGGPAEDFLIKVLGFDSVESIDASDFEGATIIADIGKPLPPELYGQFDLAMDGGTLEHVFNLPVGLANLMRLVRVGGSIYMHGPSSNLAGHGFYQYSPELLFRVFSAENGFAIGPVRLIRGRNISTEQTAHNAAFEVVDPASVGHRVNICTPDPINITVLATKTAEREPFAQPIVQSDYAAAWQGAREAGRLEGFARAHATNPIVAFLIGLRARYRASFWNRRYFKRVW